MHCAFTRTDHRPWPLPPRRWTWRQSWQELLFIHWPVPVDRLRHLVPPGLTIKEFDGTSWVGVAPFRMTGVMRRPLPDLPWISAFPELNVRLYVEAEGKPGVWFLSLDAANPLAVWAARKFFHLPYYRADMGQAGAALIARDAAVRILSIVQLMTWMRLCPGCASNVSNHHGGRIARPPATEGTG